MGLLSSRNLTVRQHSEVQVVLDVAGFDSLHHQSGRVIVRLEYE